MGYEVEFRILGPLEIHHDGEPVPLSRGLDERLLAVLLLSPNRVVPWGSLFDTVWDDPPATAKRQVQNRLSALRSKLYGGDLIVADGPGYRIRVECDQLDACRFDRLVNEARALPPDRKVEAVDLLRAALALWRGPALAGLTGRAIEAGAARLDEHRLTTHEHYIDLQLEFGHHVALVGELNELVTAHPTRERLVGQLMLALYRSARQADALKTYHRLRNRLVDDLGVEPSPQLQQLYTAILRNEVVATDNLGWPYGQAATDEPGSPGAKGGPVPRQLPAVISHFVGREREISSLDRILALRGDATAIVISAIAGTAGVGKTALAVRWAHRVRHRFPDGQLYVNLRGFDPTGAIMAPASAVRLFLDALEVPAQRIPPDPAAQVNLYRSVLADKRMLVLLDNAHDPDQVRPLLPAAPGCLVLVTSRNQLTGLVAADGAHHLALDLLTAGEARDLVSYRLGPVRAAAESDAVDEIINACARLPLALAIVTARAEVAKDLPLAVLAYQLRTGGDRLDTLSTGDDPRTDVRGVFSWSYQALTPAAARLFRLFGLHPGPDISTPAAASLAGITPDAVRPVLAELTRASLLTEPTTGRYTCHDLLRIYASQLAHIVDAEEQRHAATGRILDHYLHTAHPADRLLNPTRDPILLAPPRAGVTPEQLSDYAQVWDWFTAQRPVLLAAVTHAAAAGFDTHTWQLPYTMWTFLNRRGHWHDQVALGQTAVAAAQRLADPTAEAHTHRLLASSYTHMGRLDDAHTQLREALDLAVRAGEQTQLAHTHHHLAFLWERRGQPAQALHHAQQALHLHQTAGHQRGQATALNQVGWYHTLLGEHQQALTSCQQALTLHQQLGHREGQAATWDSLGHAHHHLGQHTQALACYQQALTLFRDLGDCYHEAETLIRLGDTHHATGNPQAARDAWQHALTILDDLDHPDAENVRAMLATVDAILRDEAR